MWFKILTCLIWLTCLVSSAFIPKWNTTIPDQNKNESAGLPVLHSISYTVMNATTTDNKPTPNGTFNHGPMISYYNNLYYISWYNSPKSEAEYQRVLCKTSTNGERWMDNPIELFPNITSHPGIYNEPFTIINDHFYVSASVLINAGNENQNNKEYIQIMRKIIYINNINDYNISDIFWLTSTVPDGFQKLNYQTYLEMPQDIINDIKIYFNSLITENVEPVTINNQTFPFNQTTSMYLLPPSSNNNYVDIMLLLRADTNLFSSTCQIDKKYIDMNNLFNLFTCRAGTQMFVNLFQINYNLNNSLMHNNYQNICNWTKPQITDIPDAPARTCISNLPSNIGGYYLIGNQIGDMSFEDRNVLTLSVTDKSGLYFNSVYAIRYDPPSVLYPGTGKMKEFAYPSAMWNDNYLYITYDIDKEDIGISIVNLDDLY